MKDNNIMSIKDSCRYLFSAQVVFNSGRYSYSIDCYVRLSEKSPGKAVRRAPTAERRLQESNPADRLNFIVNKWRENEIQNN